MFQTNSNWDIKISIGDEAQFPLFLNKKTRANPVRYEFHEDDGCEIYFYLNNIWEPSSNYLLKKTFTSSGDRITQKRTEQPVVSSGHTNINEYGDMVISLDSTDTSDLEPGQYIYQVRAKVKTANIENPNLVIDKENEYQILTVTNRYNFYIMDDNYNEAW